MESALCKGYMSSTFELIFLSKQKLPVRTICNYVFNTRVSVGIFRKALKDPYIHSHVTA